jgi:hypothetical protein
MMKTSLKTQGLGHMAQSGEIDQQAYKHAEELRYKGYAATDILKELEGQGMERSAAQAVLARLYKKSDTAGREAAFKTMLIGGSICLIGIMITLVTFEAAAGGGRFIVAFGAILGGGYKFLEGLYTFIRS